MPFSDLRWSRPHVELAMEIAMTLADLAQAAEGSAKIPGYLAKALDLEPITLAIVTDEPTPQIPFHASSGKVETPELPRNLLAIHRQTRSGSADDDGLAELAIDRDPFSRATVIARDLGDKHRMLLVLHQHVDDAGLSAGLVDLLQLIADKLAKLLACEVAWKAQKNVGEPFGRLTQREWSVLQGLSSEAGEKQLADDLGLSPHTLHSHIKSIYRKLGVQGRLLLMGQVNKARQELRLANIASTKPILAALATTPAVALAG